MAGDGVRSREGGKTVKMDRVKGIRNRQQRGETCRRRGRGRGEEVGGSCLTPRSAALDLR